MFWIMKTNAPRHVELSKIAVNTISGWENCISLNRIMNVKCHSTWARTECSRFALTKYRVKGINIVLNIVYVCICMHVYVCVCMCVPAEKKIKGRRKIFVQMILHLPAYAAFFKMKNININ